jgi:hypothetical protein
MTDSDQIGLEEKGIRNERSCEKEKEKLLFLFKLIQPLRENSFKN